MFIYWIMIHWNTILIWWCSVLIFQYYSRFSSLVLSMQLIKWYFKLFLDYIARSTRHYEFRIACSNHTRSSLGSTRESTNTNSNSPSYIVNYVIAHNIGFVGSAAACKRCLGQCQYAKYVQIYPFLFTQFHRNNLFFFFLRKF